MNLFDTLADPTCRYCNLVLDLCQCPSSKSAHKVLSHIGERVIKGNKWVTEITGLLDPKDFKILKDKLGTGGKYQVQMSTLRGKIASRAQGLLQQLGYHVC